MREGVLPTLNLSEKKFAAKVIESRPTNVIAKREAFQQQHPLIAPTDTDQVLACCYQNFEDFARRIGKLKLPEGWTILENENFVEIEFIDKRYLHPKYQIFVKDDLTYTLRCHGWIITQNELLQQFPSFKNITLSNFLLVLKKFQVCQGVYYIGRCNFE